MRICRYNDNRIGLVRGDEIFDASAVLGRLPGYRWPLPTGDQLIAHLDMLKPALEAEAAKSTPIKVSSVKLLSPVANPNKIIGAPVNYQKHLAESRADAGINFGTDVKSIEHYGLFLKANSALVGAGEGVALRHTDRRNDHEAELAVVIGRVADRIKPGSAFDYVAGYSIGLDMTVRGPEDRSLRKSIDTYAVLGPWLTTADEVADPDNLDFALEVDGEPRQASNTKFLIFSVSRLIEYASQFYTLYPGDIIMTGTPEGVAPVTPGCTMTCRIAGVGEMAVKVRAA